jgi:hypothetical protein
MSIDNCNRCEAAVDTDYDAEFYDGVTEIGLCQTCREYYHAVECACHCQGCGNELAEFETTKTCRNCAR